MRYPCLSKANNPLSRESYFCNVISGSSDEKSFRFSFTVGTSEAEDPYTARPAGPIPILTKAYDKT